MFLARKIQRGAQQIPVTDANFPYLRVWYTGDNFSGSTLVDESPNGNDIPPVGSPTTTTGVISNAVSFPTAGDYYKASAAMPSNIQSDTIGNIQAWIQYAGTTNFVIPFYIANDAGTNALYFYYNKTANNLLFQIVSNGSTVVNNQRTINLSTGFHLVDIDFDGTTYDLRVDNTSYAWTSEATSNKYWFSDIFDTTGMKIWYSNATQTGNVDNGRLFGTSLTSAQRDSIWNGGSGA